MARKRYVWCKGTDCRTVFKLQDDGPSSCPDCGTSWTPTPVATSNLALQERLYGTSNNPVFNWGLGTYTTGKSDRRAKAREKKLIPRDE